MQEPSKNSAVEQIIERFNQYSDWEDRYRELIKTGKSLNELDESQKIDKFKVRGCQSQVWLVPELKDGKVIAGYGAATKSTIPKIFLRKVGETLTANFAPKYPPIIKVVAIINAYFHSTYPAL